MKAYTDLEQSRKLAEILPIDSADMCYPYDRHLNKMYGDIPYVMGYKRFNEDIDFPCWSLGALSEFILPYIADDDGDIYKFYLSKDDLDRWIAYYKSDDVSIYICEESDNMIDVILEMVYWLKKEEYI